MTHDECRPVQITVDGQTVVMRVHSGGPFVEADREALQALARAAAARLAREHPHAAVIQELMLAWTSVRRQLPATDSRIGRNRDIGAVKARMSDAIGAVREALGETGATS